MSNMIIEEWRDLWSFKVDFIFVSLAWVFSLANFLNFPVLLREYGGAAFIVAYVACLLACCLPLIIMELAVGQLTGRAPVQAFLNLCPLFKGVGVAQLIYCLVIAAMFALYLSYTFLKTFDLFWTIMEPEAPWLTCDNSWNNEFCKNETTQVVFTSNFDLDSSIMQYMNGEIIKPSHDIEEPGELQWRTIAAMGAVWFLVFLAVCAGVRWLGKVCYFTFLIPVLLLVALLIRALTQSVDRTGDLIMNLFEPDWDKLLQIPTWIEALRRSIYSTGVGMGVFITLGSYNKRNNNLVGDSFIILFVHLFLTALQIFTAIAILGYFAEELDMDIEKFVDALPTSHKLLYRLDAAVSILSMNKIWGGILLFVVIFIMLNALYMITLSVLAAAEDALGEKASRCFPRIGLALAIVCLAFAIGLGLATQAAPYAIELMDYFLDHLTLWVILVFEILAVAWFYCAHMLGRDIKQMVAPMCCWITGFSFMEFLYIMPAAPIFILVMKLSSYNFGNLGSAITDAKWAEPVGWLIAVVPLLPIPFFMIFIIVRTCLRGPGLTYWQRFKYTIISPLRYEVIKPAPRSGYSSNAAGYVLLPQAPLAEPENYNEVYTERVVKVSNI